jgi:hypothetical protein
MSESSDILVPHSIAVSAAMLKLLLSLSPGTTAETTQPEAAKTTRSRRREQVRRAQRYARFYIVPGNISNWIKNSIPIALFMTAYQTYILEIIANGK